jgi:hypothetical protein
MKGYTYIATEEKREKGMWLLMHLHFYYNQHFFYYDDYYHC